MDITFAELKVKNIINTVNGKCLGKPCDLVIDLENTCVIGLVAPGCRAFLRRAEDIFIPWDKIIKIGDDVILVDICEKSC